MIGVILFEVTSRYVLNTPTVWAYDVSYMLNGTVIMLAGALAMKGNQHVVIDIVSQLFRQRTKTIIEVTVFSLLLLPALGFITTIAWEQSWRAFQNGIVEHVSPWRPVLWPFRLMIAIGLSVLWLQILARTLVAALGLIRTRKSSESGV
ncbi:TRAP transporter small permease subunit [Gemmobacter sp.]|uniref:TRAP transporter small permease subunit n=1 Tax=Gemmobacter sp. TaxID=1898957 RepID=UPI002AFF13DF|nr:TRAP transporter small permease subunit [Gemmobacter sp.]